MTVLYLSQNGIADHIGQSQVAPYLLGLAARGYDIHLLSAEKPGRDALKARYARAFANAGIRWTTIRYHNRPPLLGSVWDLVSFARAARRIVRSEPVRLIHCRSHPPMPVAILAKRWSGARLIFDFRDFWADGGIAHGRLVPVYRAWKRLEAGFVAAADGMVTLTRRAADHLRAVYPDPSGAVPTRYQVIPCCADFALFTPGEGRDRRRAELGIAAGATVLVYVGSLGPDYLLADMMRLFAELRALRSGAVFLIVCNNDPELAQAAAAAAGLPPEQIRTVSAAREEVPSYLAAADLSVVFIRADLSKIGCSPTKLAELFACGVPVIANAGVGDLDAILSPARNGSVALPALTAAAMREGLETLLAADRPDAATIRQNSLEFALEAGIDRYARLYEALGERPAKAG